jgi:hypothetical protein
MQLIYPSTKPDIMIAQLNLLRRSNNYQFDDVLMTDTQIPTCKIVGLLFSRPVSLHVCVSKERKVRVNCVRIPLMYPVSRDPEDRLIR